MMRKRLSVFLSMLKIGIVGFGGGNALIPVIEEEVVEKKKLLTEEDYNDDVIVASITPGALPVEIACGVGKQVSGKAGMLISSVAVAFPGVALCILLLAVLSGSSQGVLHQISFGAMGIGVFIIFLLTEYIHRILKESKANHRIRQDVIIMLGVFFLTGGKELYQLIGIDRVPFFDISTIDMLILAFFFIFFTRARYNKVNLGITGIIGILYACCVGKCGLISLKWVKWTLWLIMLSLAIWGLQQSLKTCKKTKTFAWKAMLVDEGIWILFLVILSIPAVLITGESLLFLAKGFFSSILSFGGGDAYLTVAEGMFVECGYISSKEFYGQLVAIANILPGSILCKMLAGVGYFIGFHETGNVLGGSMVALAGFACSVFGSCSVFALIFNIYRCFEELSIFKILKVWIRPIVAGLMITVILAMVYENMKTGWELEWTRGFSLLLSAGVYGGILLLKKKWNLNSLCVIGLCAAFTVGICNL